jgi:hypothetical protein
MTVQGPYQIAESIAGTLQRIDLLVDEIREAAGEAAGAETDFEREFAKARLKARAAEGKKVTEDAARDQATVDTAELRLRHLTAKNNLTVLRAVLSAEQAKLDGLRTMSASVRVAGG